MILTVKKADTFFSATIGLIGISKPYALMLKTRFGIHTFGLRFPLDVIIVDQKNRVVVVKKNLQPYCFFLWHPKWDTVVELPSGTIAKNHITVGTHIVFRVIS